MNQVFRRIISSVAPALELDHPTRRADGRAPSPLAAETALLNDILNAPPEKFGRLSDGELFADAFDGGCPADVTADPAHGGRGGTMGDAAAAKRPFTADENKAASNKAAKNLLEDLMKQINTGTMRDRHEIANRIELATLLMK